MAHRLRVPGDRGFEIRTARTVGEALVVAMRSQDRLLQSIEARRTIALDRFIYALGIRLFAELARRGVSREQAYEMVQRNAMKVWEQGKDFLTELKGDGEVTAHLSADELAGLFDMAYHTKHVDTIFARVFV